MKNINRHFLIPALLFVAAILIAHALGLWRVAIDTSYIQLLDANELKSNPFDALLYLHSQPPLLNALFALILNLSDFLSVADVTIVKCIFLVGGLAGSILLFLLLLRATNSAVLSALGLLVLLGGPSYHVFGSLFFYPFILQVLFLALFWLIAKYVEDGRQAFLFLIVLAAAAITNMRSLFHPMWAICLFLMVIACKKWISKESENARARQYLLGLALLIALLSIWPLKNYLAFGQFTNSTLAGFNLAHHLPIARNPIIRESMRGTSDEVERYLDSFRPVFESDSLKVLTDTRKSDGSMNWNHISFLLANKDLKRRAIQWRLDNPDIYLRTTLVHYLIWCSPSVQHPYDLSLLGPENRSYQGYARLYNKPLNADIRELVERLTPNFLLHEAAYVRLRPVKYTVYALIFFPLLLACTIALVALNMKKKRPIEAIVLACLFCHIFAMAVVCLTDGQEGNRMSFSTLPAIIIMAGYTISEAAGAIRSRKAQSVDETAGGSDSGEQGGTNSVISESKDTTPSDAGSS